MQDHDVYKKRLRADGTPIDEGVKHDIGPENIDELSTAAKDENGTVCGSCYGAQTASQQCCNTCDEVRCINAQRQQYMFGSCSATCAHKFWSGALGAVTVGETSMSHRGSRQQQQQPYQQYGLTMPTLATLAMATRHLPSCKALCVPLYCTGCQLPACPPPQAASLLSASGKVRCVTEKCWSMFRLARSRQYADEEC